jgi:hypothetical protein
VSTCDWTGTFFTQVIGAHLFPKGSDITEVLVPTEYESATKYFRTNLFNDQLSGLDSVLRTQHPTLLPLPIRSRLKPGRELFTEAPVNKNLPLFLCLLIRN